MLAAIRGSPRTAAEIAVQLKVKERQILKKKKKRKEKRKKL